MTPHPNKYFDPIIKVWCVLWIPTVLVLYWYPQQDYPRLFLQTLELHWQNSRQRTLSGLWTNSLKGLLIYYYKQCLGSGSARFWLPGSGSAKICGSTDPDPRGKIIKYQPKTAKKTFLIQNSNLNFWKREIIKISSFLNGSSNFRIKISEKNKTKNLKIILC